MVTSAVVLLRDRYYYRKIQSTNFRLLGTVFASSCDWPINGLAIVSCYCLKAAMTPRRPSLPIYRFYYLW